MRLNRSTLNYGILVTQLFCCAVGAEVTQYAQAKPEGEKIYKSYSSTFCINPHFSNGICMRVWAPMEMKPASNRLAKLFPASILASFLSSPNPGVKDMTCSLAFYFTVSSSPFPLFYLPLSFLFRPPWSLRFYLSYLIFYFSHPSGFLPSSMADLREDRKTLSSRKPPARHNLPIYTIMSLWIQTW